MSVDKQHASTLDVVTYGEPLVVFAADDAVPLAQAARFHKGAAGAELNVALGLARLGLRVGYVSRVGADSFGRFITDTLQLQGVDTSKLTVDSTRSTGFYLKTATRDGSDPAIEYHRKGSAASLLSPDDDDAAYFGSARHLHLSGVAPAISAGSRALAHQIAARARTEGRQRISFDPNLRPSLWASRSEMVEQMRQLAAYAHWVMPGLEEGRIVSGQHSPDAIAAFFLDQGAEGVVIKLGAGGAYLRTATQSAVVPAVRVDQVVDTVGAGDGFAVGFISALLDGCSAEASALRGNRIAALAIQAAGDSDGLPSRDQLIDLERRRDAR